jgi:hypothetical protein
MDRAGGQETGDVFVYSSSFAQKRLWFLEQLDPGTSQYNLPANRILRGPLNLEALRAALEEIVKRHEILRTTLRTENGQPVQVIAPTAPLAFPLVDLSHLPREKAESEVRRIVNEESW